MTSNRLNVEFFVSPLPLAAVVLMALNDHSFKYAFPSFLTGKLSDFLGLFFFPLLLAAIVSLFQNFVRKPEAHWVLTSQRLLVCMFASTSLFLLVKLHTPARDFIVETFLFFGMRIQIVQDKWDLIALLSNIPCYFFGRRHFNAS